MKPIDLLIKKADDILVGEGEPFEDWRDALEIYQKAAALDSGKAYFKIGRLYEDMNNKSSVEKAVSNYKQAVRLGYLPASAALAVLYRKQREIENCNRMWRYYFSNFTLEGGETKELLLYGFEYAAIGFDSKKPMAEIDVFRKYHKEFSELFNEMYSSQVIMKLPVAKEKLSRANSIMSKEALLAAKKEVEDLSKRHIWWTEFIKYYNDCLNGRFVE